ncbi:MAG: histidine phosphatase family protein [Bacteroidota bacterium]
MKTLVLCRHAKSDWPEGVQDIRRPLKKRGIRDAHYLGEILANQEFYPDLIVTSPATRAYSTARIISAQVGYSEADIKVVESIYYEGAGQMLSFVQEIPDEVNTLMIFGHNPTMENAVRHLLQMGSAFSMPTSAMACVESYVNSWAQFDPRNTYLRWLLIPRLTRKDD